MTYDEFLVQLSDIDTEWYIDGDVPDSSHCIRTVIAGKEYCPVTAVVNHVTGAVYEMSCYDLAAKEIELNPYEANEIARAADEEKYCGYPLQHPIEPVLHDVIRGALLDRTLLT